MATRRLSDNEIARVAERFGGKVVNNAAGKPRNIREVPPHVADQFHAELERLKNNPPDIPDKFAIPAEGLGNIEPAGDGPSLLDRAAPMAIRIVPAVAGAVVGGPIGAGVGAAIGEWAGQKYEVPGPNDVNWTQVGVQGGLNMIPVGKLGNIPGVRQAAQRLGKTAVGRAFGRSATASTPAQRVIQQLPRTVAASAGRGGAIGAISGTPTRMAAGEPTTMGDVLTDVGIGAVVGSALPIAGAGAVRAKRGAEWLGGKAARNPTANTAITATLSAGGGYMGWSGGSGGAFGAASGSFAVWKATQSALNKMKKWGTNPSAKGSTPLNKLLEEVNAVTDDLSQIKVLSVDLQAAYLKKYVAQVKHLDANGIPVPQKVWTQVSRIDDTMLTPKANASIRAMSATEFLDDAGLIDINAFTNKEALKYHNSLAEAIDASSRAGKKIPEKWRQAFEGLRERLHRKSSQEYSSAIDRLAKASFVDRKSFDSAFKALTPKMQGEIHLKDSKLFEILKNRSDNTGGVLQRSTEKRTGLREILEEMRESSVVELPGAASHGGFTIPTDTAARIKRAEALMKRIDEHKGARLVPREAPVWKEELQAIVESLDDPSIVNARNADALAILRSHPDSYKPTVPTGVTYDYTPGSGAATPNAVPPPPLSGNTPPPAATVPPVSTVEGRATARGAVPHVASAKALSPSEIRNLLSNRPGLEAVIAAQKLVGKPRFGPDGKILPEWAHFERLYKELTGSLPDGPTQYAPSHVAGKYWAGGMNENLQRDKVIATRILNSSNMGSQDSVNDLVSVIENAR